MKEAQWYTCLCFIPAPLILAGDGHAAQGEGELTAGAVEISID
jgi:hypothetical protein